MDHWTPGDWGIFFVALGTFINTALIGAATFWAKIQSVETHRLIDQNTVGIQDAATKAKEAVDTNDKMVKHIEYSTNGIISAFREELALLHKENDRLIARVNELVAEKEKR